MRGEFRQEFLGKLSDCRACLHNLGLTPGVEHLLVAGDPVTHGIDQSEFAFDLLVVCPLREGPAEYRDPQHLFVSGVGEVPPESKGQVGNHSPRSWCR